MEATVNSYSRTPQRGVPTTADNSQRASMVMGF
jgi:hypothetical protein